MSADQHTPKRGEYWTRRKPTSTRRKDETPWRYTVEVRGLWEPKGGPVIVLYKRIDGSNRKTVSKPLDSFLRDFDYDVIEDFLYVP